VVFDRKLLAEEKKRKSLWLRKFHTENIAKMRARARPRARALYQKNVKRYISEIHFINL
jgi:hypothetical protein